MNDMNDIHFYSLAFLSACVSVFFNYTLTEKAIFRRYYLFLIYLRWRATKCNKTMHKWVVYITRPLGLCLYCNCTWVALIIYTNKYEHFLNYDYFLNLSLFIGLSFVFTKYIYKTIED